MLRIFDPTVGSAHGSAHGAVTDGNGRFALREQRPCDWVILLERHFQEVRPKHRSILDVVNCTLAQGVDMQAHKTSRIIYTVRKLCAATWGNEPGTWEQCPTVWDTLLQQSQRHPSQHGWARAGSSPHCGKQALQRATETLSKLRTDWMLGDADPHYMEEWTWCPTPRELASLFRKRMQSHPSLIGFLIHRSWIQECYDYFCDAEGVLHEPAYKDFAHELAKLMPRSRKEDWCAGVRSYTATYYLVPEPAAETVVLSVTV